LVRLAPLTASRPCPFEWSASICGASFGPEEVMILLPLALSTQRKAGMSALLPSRMPAYEAPV
jgi:hypothetical protein